MRGWYRAGVNWAIFGLLAVFVGLWVSTRAQVPGNGQALVQAQSPSPSLDAQSLRAVPSNPPFRFLAMGDWGARTPFQRDVAAQMASLLAKRPYQTVLLLGDNIYPDGDIKKWGKAYFTDLYAPLLSQGVQFVVALGNHDVLAGHQGDQIRFFRMPGHYYRVQKPNVDFFVIDTNRFEKDQIQQRWLQQSLQRSQAPWKVVMGHHPIYSSGEHGLNQGLRKVLEPILIKQRADFYLAGHDHDYERFQSVQGVQHIVSGGGGAYLRDFAKVLPGSLVRVKAHHFLSFEVYPTEISMQAISKAGVVIDQAHWVKPTALPVSPGTERQSAP